MMGIESGNREGKRPATGIKLGEQTAVKIGRRRVCSLAGRQPEKKRRGGTAMRNNLGRVRKVFGAMAPLYGFLPGAMADVGRSALETAALVKHGCKLVERAMVAWASG
jgi:hypothetical protein